MQYLVYAYFFVRPLQSSEWDLSCHVVACEGWIFDRWSCKDFTKTSGSSEKARSLWKIVSFLIPSKNTLYSNTCRAAVKKSSQQQPGNQAAQLSAHTGTQSCIDIVPGSYQSCNSPAQVRIQDARLGSLKAVAGDAVVVIFQVVFFRFQIIFLCPTGGGESWHQPRPGLRLWDRPDQQACPVTSFQECGISGYDGEFPGWGAELPTGQGGQSRDVLLQKPPGIHSSSAKIWCHLDSVGFRLVQHDSSSPGSLVSLGLLPKFSQEIFDVYAQSLAQWLQIKLVFFRSHTGGRCMFLESSLRANVQLRSRPYMRVFWSRNPPSYLPVLQTNTQGWPHLWAGISESGDLGVFRETIWKRA